MKRPRPPRVAFDRTCFLPCAACARCTLSVERHAPVETRLPACPQVINSGIAKTSKLTHASKVYRGVAGMALPDAFWRPNAHGVRGGIEGAFMSTTTDRKVAMQYAASGGRGFIFEIQQGMVDRGADIGWISQYPHEAEILFAPLTGLEVRSTVVDDAVLVVGVSPSINLSSLTIEQVSSGSARR